MRHPDLDHLMLHERWKDNVEAAGYYRLIQEAEQAYDPDEQPHARPLADRLRPLAVRLRPLALFAALSLARVLSFLGGLMVTWSCRLQSRYAAFSGDYALARAAENSPCS